MKKRNFAVVFGLMVLLTAVKSRQIYANEPVYGEVVSVKDGVLTIEEGTVDFANAAVLVKNGEELKIRLTDATVIKNTQGTEGEISSGEALTDGVVVAVSFADEEVSEQEAQAVTIMPNVTVEEEETEAETPGEEPSEEAQKPGGKSSSGQSGQQPPEMPDGQSGPGQNGQQPPEMPDGQSGPGQNGQQPPQMPDGQNGPGQNGQQPPQMPDGQNGPGQNGQQPPQMPDGQGGPGMGGGPGGQNSGVDSYEAVQTYEEDTDIEGEEISSTGTDENAVLVDSADATVTITDSNVTRISSDSTGGDNASFYGVGAALLATDGTLIADNCKITTDASGGAGVFAYGDGTVYVSDSTIATTQNASGGIHAAGGGTLYAWNLDVTTDGGSAAAIRSDRGGGTMVVDGGSYTSNGLGSPAIYCTADITVNDAELEATGSEAVCIEGLNTIRLFDCDLTGAMTDQDQNDITWNVIVYQSMSGDSVEGNGTFEMSGGTLTAKNGGMFYTTNTESTFILNNVGITYAQDNPFFLQVTGNSNARGWGSAGSNGADCLFTAITQDMEGDVIWDSISQLDLYMTDNSTLTGAIVQDETWAGNGGDGYCSVVIDSTSTWVVTGDSTLTSLSSAGTIVDEDGETVTVVGTDGTVYAEGSSAYTVTVENYSDTADTTGAGIISSWENYAVEKPELS